MTQPVDTDVSADSSRRPMVLLLLAAAAGIGIDRLWPCAALLWWGAGLAAWLAWLALCRYGRWGPAAVPLLLSLSALFAAWHHVGWHEFSREEIGRFARDRPEPVCFRGRALSAAERLPALPFDPMRTLPTGDQTRLLVEVDAIRDRTEWRPASGRVRIIVRGHLLGVHPGDPMTVIGQLRSQSPPHNPGAHDFAADARRDRRLAMVRCDFPDCVVLATDKGPRWWHGAGVLLARWRERSNRILWRYLDHHQAGLAAAILLGERNEIGRDETEAFVETGTVHLLAISGSNVAVLAGGLFLALRLGWLSQRYGALLVAGLTVFYALLTDSQPPVLRAMVIVVVACGSLYTGRRALSFNTLALAALVVLAVNPADLFRVGPQLSFVAVATLIWVHPFLRRWRLVGMTTDPIDRLLDQARPWPVRSSRGAGAWLLRLTVVGVAVGLVALPLTMYHFHLVSPVGVLLTPFLLVPMSVALLSGLGVLLFGWLLPPLAMACGSICDGSLSTISVLVAWGHETPGAFFHVPGPALWWLAGFYGLAAWVVLCPRLAPSTKWSAAIVGGWIAVGIAAPFLRGSTNELRCTILSVGHGSAVVLELPDGRVMLYDAGRLGSPLAAADAVANCLWSRGRTHIDAMVISHADADHYNAVPRLLEQFSVGAVFVAPVMRDSRAPGVVALFAAIEKAGVPIRSLSAGDRLAGGEVTISVLHPPRKGVLAGDPDASDNANSVVLGIEYLRKRLLLPGDLESPGLEDLMAEEPWNCDVLMAPHHGSPRSHPAGFAAWSRPEWTVVSDGERQELSAVRTAYRGPGRRLLNTAHNGAVTTTFGPAGLKVEPFCHSPDDSP